MNHMMATAERLHAAEDALGEFLMRWAVDELINELGDRVHGDIARESEKFSVCEGSYSNYRAGMDD
jgi:hypothetical protein